MRITKVKIKKDTILIGYELLGKDGENNIYTVESEDAPKPSFYQVLNSFAEIASEITDQEKNVNNFQIVELNISYPDGLKTLSIGASIFLSDIPCYWDIKTPKLSIPQYDSDGNKLLKPCLPESAVHLLDIIEQECKDYIDGNRQQVSLKFNRNE